MSAHLAAAPLGRVLAAALLAAALAGAGIFHVWARTRVLAAGYELARVEAESRRLTAERDRLVLEVTTLRAPGRIERYARERLGMAPPAPGAVVAVGSGGGGWARAAAGRGPAEPGEAAVRVALSGPRR